MSSPGNLKDDVAEPLEDLLGEVRHLSRSRRRQTTLLICLAVLSLMAFGFRIAVWKAPPEPRRGEFLTFTGLHPSGEQNITEWQILMFGSEHLLLPGIYASALQNLPGPRAQDPRAPDVFSPFPPVITASRDTLMPPEFKPELKVSLPSDLLSEPFWTLTETFGQQKLAINPLPRRGAAWRVTSLAGGAETGQVMLNGEWKETLGGPAFLGRRWDIAQFTVLVGDAGLLGDPLLERGSGIPEVDLSAREAAARDIPWAAVPAGYYRVTVAP